MKKETMLKIILVLIMGVILFARPINVFAAEGSGANLNDLWEDLETDEEPTPEQTPAPEQTPTPEPTPEPEPTPSTPSTDTTPETKEELPDAGLAEDTMMVVAIVVLGVTAIYAYKKTSEYKEI